MKENNSKVVKICVGSILNGKLSAIEILSTSKVQTNPIFMVKKKRCVSNLIHIKIKYIQFDNFGKGAIYKEQIRRKTHYFVQKSIGLTGSNQSYRTSSVWCVQSVDRPQNSCTLSGYFWQFVFKPDNTLHVLESARNGDTRKRTKNFVYGLQVRR